MSILGALQPTVSPELEVLLNSNKTVNDSIVSAISRLKNSISRLREVPESLHEIPAPSDAKGILPKLWTEHYILEAHSRELHSLADFLQNIV